MHPRSGIIAPVRDALAPGERPVHWVGSSKRDFLSFPEKVKDAMGNALGIAQFGGTRPRRGTTRPCMANRSADRDDEVTHGTSNVFADLGYPDSTERQARLRLALALNRVLDERTLTQAEVAKLLGVSQPKVSALRNYKLAGFSVERLMTFLTALDRDVRIVIRQKPRSRRSARISVEAA